MKRMNMLGSIAAGLAVSACGVGVVSEPVNADSSESHDDVETGSEAVQNPARPRFLIAEGVTLKDWATVTWGPGSKLTYGNCYDDANRVVAAATWQVDFFSVTMNKHTKTITTPGQTQWTWINNSPTAFPIGGKYVLTLRCNNYKNAQNKMTVVGQPAVPRTGVLPTITAPANNVTVLPGSTVTVQWTFPAGKLCADGFVDKPLTGFTIRVGKYVKISNLDQFQESYRAKLPASSRSTVIPAGKVTAGNNSIFVGCNGWLLGPPVVVKVPVLPAPPPPPPPRTWSQNTGRVHFSSPGSGANVVRQQDVIVQWNYQPNNGYSCFEPVNKLMWSFAYASVEVYSEAEKRVVGTFSAPAKAGGKAGYGQLVVPAFTFAPGVNILRFRCEGIPMVQNEIGVYGVDGPRKSFPPQRVFTNPSTTNKSQGLPHIVSYDSRNGLTWHPGDYCANPDPTKRLAGWWSVEQYDYRSHYSPFAGYFPVSSLKVVPFDNVFPIYRTNYHRYSPQALHFPGACAVPSRPLQLVLKCNGWEQDRIEIPCSVWTDQ